ncbi:hypothetical protein VB715_16755 [Crocosphaera sp. UHCC 0190]|uniref:hypothetical protein n=1 Tax=Crocosphaera sp. UHCC 0190 TaxID=3110246 RepID=UPI002B201BA9|nr:hypothetical protein [Crocosphaera sp. UHCC 0190]MEA5511425.1 hypothetical protein [Crocosphaera sp. UHCC 0190]
MKLFIALFSLAWLLNSCSDPKQSGVNSEQNCPSPPSSPPMFKIKGEEEIYRHWQSLDIIETEETITFKSAYYDFIFCQGNQSWIVKKGTYKPAETPPKTYEDAIAQLGDPPYKTLEWQGKSYQYRVFLDPNPFPDFKVEPKQVILELIQPDNNQPQRQILYTLDQVKAKKTGIQLGIPAITASIIDQDRFYWAISPEQGEGNGGIATLVTYDPKLQKISLIQPPELAKAQINDLAIAKTSTGLIFWLGTQISGEGNPYLGGMGLVSYDPKSQVIKSYNPRNSPLIGVIPQKLALYQDKLWVATGNGVCQVKWQKVQVAESWQCWQFKLQAKIPKEEIKLYSSLLDGTPDATLKPAETGKTLEVLWWSPQDYQIPKGRYEIVYQSGFKATLKENGAILWSEIYQDSQKPHSWQAILYWPGRDWVWKGDRFVRPFDSVPLNSFGGGPGGISTWNMPQQQRPEIYAMRGNLDLIKLTKNLTEVKHYSAWVDDSLLQPSVNIVPVSKPETLKPNPLQAILEKLK